MGSAATMLVRRDALEFRLSGCPGPFLAQVEGGRWRELARSLKGSREIPLEAGAFESLRWRSRLPRSMFGLPNCGSPYSGCELVSLDHGQTLRLHFLRRPAPAALMRAILEAFGADASQLAAVAAEEKSDGEGQLEQEHAPAAAARAEAEGQGREHAAGQPIGPGLQRQGDGQAGQAGQVQRDVKPAPKLKRLQRPVKVRVADRRAAQEAMRAKIADAKQRQARAIELLQQNVG